MDDLKKENSALKRRIKELEKSNKKLRRHGKELLAILENMRGKKGKKELTLDEERLRLRGK